MSLYSVPLDRSSWLKGAYMYILEKMNRLGKLTSTGMGRETEGTGKLMFPCQQ